MADAVFTVGHSNHPVETFLGLLAMHGVQAVADVRSMPYSRYNPQFDRESLKGTLKAAGLGYVYLGAELGVRSGDPAFYRDGKVRYDLLAGTGGVSERDCAGAGGGTDAAHCADVRGEGAVGVP